MPKKSDTNVPSELPSMSAIKKLLTACNETASLMGSDEKIKVELTKNGGEITQKTQYGTQRILVTPGYKEISQGNIRGLPIKKQMAIVRELRNIGLNQSQIAERLNVSQTRISQIENHKK